MCEDRLPILASVSMQSNQLHFWDPFAFEDEYGGQSEVGDAVQCLVSSEADRVRLWSGVQRNLQDNVSEMEHSVGEKHAELPTGGSTMNMIKKK